MLRRRRILVLKIKRKTDKHIEENIFNVYGIGGRGICIKWIHCRSNETRQFLHEEALAEDINDKLK